LSSSRQPPTPSSDERSHERRRSKRTSALRPTFDVGGGPVVVAFYLAMAP